MAHSTRTRSATRGAAGCLVCLFFGALAAAQDLEGRFYPEKQAYLAGEPVYIVLELRNAGDHSVWAEDPRSVPCFGDQDIEVFGASRLSIPSQETLGCMVGWAGDCLSGNAQIKPGQKQTVRILLNEFYQIDQPGEYQIRATRQLPVGLTRDSWLDPNQSKITVSSDFDVLVTEATEDELRAVYQPLVKNLNNSDWFASHEALEAITDIAPPFLEDVIIRLADKRDVAYAAIEALARLNTEGSRAKLAALAEHDGRMQAQALMALAATHDRTYLPLLLRLDENATPEVRGFAILSTGDLGGERSVDFLAAFLSNTDPKVRQSAVQGLANTASRRAVPLAIGALGDPNESVRWQAMWALSQLTHRSDTLRYQNSPNAREIWQQWLQWWADHWKDAPVYGPTECASPQPFD